MDDREENIIEAAIRVFFRYGVRRTTMNDIATEAGVARQTLYNIYPNKEEVIRATVRLFYERSVTAVETGCAETDDLSEKLDIIFEHLTIKHYDLLAATPEADDIISGFNDAAREEMTAGNERCRIAIETVLTPYSGQLDEMGLGLPDFSDYIRRTLAAFKYDAKNKKHLMQLLNSLKVLVLKAVEGK